MQSDIVRVVEKIVVTYPEFNKKAGAVFTSQEDVAAFTRLIEISLGKNFKVNETYNEAGNIFDGWSVYSGLRAESLFAIRESGGNLVVVSDRDLSGANHQKVLDSLNKIQDRMVQKSKEPNTRINFGISHSYEAVMR